MKTSSLSRKPYPILRIAVFLLTIVSVSNAFWERIMPFEIDISMGILILVGFIATLSLKRLKWKRCILSKPILILIMAFILTLTAMAFRGSDYVDETLRQFFRLAMIMGLSFIIVQLLGDIESVKEILKVFVISTSGVAFSALFNFWFGIKLISIFGVEFELINPWGGIESRLGSFYEQPNTFATPLILAISLGITFAISNNKLITKLFWIILVIICSASLLMSQSRSAIWGSIFSFLIICAILLKIQKLPRYLPILLLVFSGTIGILIWSGMMEPIFRRLTWDYYIYQQMTGAEPSRLEIWRQALPIVLHNPFGYGAETKYIVGKALGFGEKSLHNAFVGSLVSIGVLGFIGIVLLCVNPLIYLWKLSHKINDTYVCLLSLGLFSGLVGFWIHNLFHSVIHWLVIWLYFACVAAVVRHASANVKVKRE